MHVTPPLFLTLLSIRPINKSFPMGWAARRSPRLRVVVGRARSCARPRPAEAWTPVVFEEKKGVDPITYPNYRLSNVIYLALCWLSHIYIYIYSYLKVVHLGVIDPSSPPAWLTTIPRLCLGWERNKGNTGETRGKN